MTERRMLEQVRDELRKLAFNPPKNVFKQMFNLADSIDAHLAQPAQAVDADEAMVERALTYRAMQEDGAVWPDAYGADEQAAEREQMRNVLAAALNTQGPKAYCRSCQRAGMSNCGYFDECSGATCITCHRPFTRAIGNTQAEGRKVPEATSA